MPLLLMSGISLHNKMQLIHNSYVSQPSYLAAHIIWYIDRSIFISLYTCVIVSLDQCFSKLIFHKINSMKSELKVNDLSLYEINWKNVHMFMGILIPIIKSYSWSCDNLNTRLKTTVIKITVEIRTMYLWLFAMILILLCIQIYTRPTMVIAFLHNWFWDANQFSKLIVKVLYNVCSF